MTEERGSEEPSGGDWAKMFTELWNPLMGNWADMFKPGAAQQVPLFDGRMGESVHAAAKLWRTVFSAMGEPEAFETFQKATQITPDLVLGFAQTCIQGFMNFQDQANEWVRKRAAAKDSIDIRALDKEFIQQWSDIYEKEYSKYLQIPQIGLGRFYQERAMRVADKYNVFQGVFSEFLHMLYLPLEKAFKSLQEKMAEMTEAGPLDEKSKTYYNLWVRLLEGHYMELFKQPEFTDSLGRTLGALTEYSAAKQAVVNDILKAYAIPTHNDLDDLYKEIYLLKKRIRAYEKEQQGEK